MGSCDPLRELLEITSEAPISLVSGRLKHLKCHGSSYFRLQTDACPVIGPDTSPHADCHSSWLTSGLKGEKWSLRKCSPGKNTHLCWKQCRILIFQTIIHEQRPQYVYQFFISAITIIITTGLMANHNTPLLPHSSAGQKSEMGLSGLKSRGWQNYIPF